MTDAPSKNASAPKTVRVVAVVTWLAAGLIGGATLVVTLVDYFAHAAIPARTVGGVGVMVVSAMTTVAAVILLLSSKRFRVFPTSRQIAVGIAAPAGCLLLLASLMIIGLNSTTPVLPLPVTPTVTLRFDGARIPQIEVNPEVATNGGWNAYGSLERGFEYECFVGYIPGSIWPLRQFAFGSANVPKQSLVKIAGMESANHEPSRISMQLTTSETVNVAVAGMAAAEIMMNDKPVALPTEIQPGSYTLTVTRSPEVRRERSK